MKNFDKLKLVTIGGGTGMFSLLRGLKYFPIDITAVVTVSDDGGSSGKLRQQFSMPAPGDIRNVLVALSEVEPLVEELFQYRFDENSNLNGHPTGNLLLAAMYEITGDFPSAVSALCQVLNVKGRVFPSTIEAPKLCATTINGTVVVGESNIGMTNYPIERVYFDREYETSLEVVEAILKADAIVLGPGSLFTSVMPNLLVPQIRDALLQTKAKIIYIANIMMEANETRGFSTCDHIKAIHKHVGVEHFINTVVVNDDKIPLHLRQTYKDAHDIDVSPVDIDKIKDMNIEIVTSRLVDQDADFVRHDSLKLAASIFSYLIE